MKKTSLIVVALLITISAMAQSMARMKMSADLFLMSHNHSVFNPLLNKASAQKEKYVTIFLSVDNPDNAHHYRSMVRT